MAESTRRSGRATKGQHRGLDEAEATPPPKKASGRGRKKAQPEPEAEEEDAIIRCVCGTITEDKEDPRAMIMCDQCTAWQHNECMGISEDDDEIPEDYYCEQCRPSNHKALLKKISRGEKPWEELTKQREAEALEEKALAEKALEEKEQQSKKGKGKKAKRGRPSAVKTDPVETNGASDHQEDTIKSEKDVHDDAVAQADAATPSLPATGNKRKLHDDSPAATRSPSEVGHASKIRKASSPGVNSKQPTATNRRKSSNQVSSKQDHKNVPLQTKLVNTISELQNQDRQRTAIGLKNRFEGYLDQAKKAGNFTVNGQSESTYAEQLALGIEYALYLNFWGSGSKPGEQYGSKGRQIFHNTMSNADLRHRVLTGALSPNELCKMSSDDMASKKRQETDAEILRAVEKQHTLIQEDGPRIRRTHKGEELVDNDTHMADSNDTTFTAPIRKRPSEVDTALKEASPELLPTQSPEPVELPESIDEPAKEVKQPLKIDTQATAPPVVPVERKSSSTFNIHDVWSGVKATDPEHRNRRQSKPTEPPAQSLQQRDAEVDRLLTDEKSEDEEPYSPKDFHSGPDAPIWHGQVAMPNIATFSGSGKHAGGADLNKSIPWSTLLPPTLNVEGRIATSKADEYMCSIRFSQTSEFSIVSVTANENEEEQKSFEKLFHYFQDRNRYGVITKKPVANVKDTYVVPLEANVEKKPEFIELLDDCKLEFPSPERKLLLCFVIKVNNSPTAAQQTPQQPEVGALNSPAIATGQQPTPISGHPGFQGSPPNVPYPPTPAQYSNYPGSPSAQGTHVPPHPLQPHLQQSTYTGPVGLPAAQQALGELSNAPAVQTLLQQAPNSGIPEFEVVRQLMENVPACRNDYIMLHKMLTAKLQEQSGQP